MAKHIITIDGVALVAANEDVYTVVAGSDGNDYIVEDVEGLGRVWKVYNPEETHDSSTFVESAPIPKEDGSQDTVENLPKKKGRKPKETIEGTDGLKEIERKRGRKPKQGDTSTPSMQDPTPMVPVVEKKKLVKKVTVSEAAHGQSKIQAIEPTDNSNKKLSKYHAFIKEYLANHSEIVWNKRMQAANEAWKEEKKNSS